MTESENILKRIEHLEDKYERVSLRIKQFEGEIAEHCLSIKHLSRDKESQEQYLNEIREEYEELVKQLKEEEAANDEDQDETDQAQTKESN